MDQDKLNENQIDTKRTSEKVEPFHMEMLDWLKPTGIAVLIFLYTNQDFKSPYFISNLIWFIAAGIISGIVFYILRKNTKVGLMITGAIPYIVIAILYFTQHKGF